MRLLLIAIFTKSWFVCYPLPSKLSPGHAAHSNNVYVRRDEDIKGFTVTHTTFLSRHLSPTLRQRSYLK